MSELTYISAEDLRMIEDAKNNAAFAKEVARRAELEYQNATLIAKNITLGMFIKYGLSSKDQIDNQGNIIYFEKEEKNETE